MGDVFTSGDQPVERGFSEWAGVKYSGPFVSPLRQLKAFNFTPLVRRRAYAYASVEEWEGVMSNVAEEVGRLIRTLKSDAGLYAMERAHLEKAMVNWRAIGYGRLVFASNFRSESEAQAEALRPYARRRCTAMLKTLSSDPARYKQVADAAVIRLNKGKGAPWFQPGTDHGAGLLLALLGRKVKRYSDLRDLLQERGGFPMEMMMFTRVQANRKEVPERSIIAGRVTQIGQMRACKIRTVKAPPFAENNVTAPIFEVMKQLEVDTWPERHVTDARKASAIAARGRSNFASDLSTADDTISLQTLEMWHEEQMVPLATALHELGVVERWQCEFTIEYDLKMMKRRILAPARNDGETACWLEMIGGVKSGDRGTTEKDLSIISSRNDASMDWCASHGIKVDYVSWGDDILVITDDARAKEVWFSAPGQSHLWIDKVEPDSTYMSKRMPDGYGYFSRMVARRVNREPHEEPTDDIGAALSIRASHDVLKGVSRAHPLEGRYLQTLKRCVPRLRTACEIAERATTLELMRAYAQVERPKGASVSERHLTDQLEEEDTEYAEEMDSYLTELFTAKPVYSKRLGRKVPAQLRESEVREEAKRWTTASILRGLTVQKRRK